MSGRVTTMWRALFVPPRFIPLISWLKNITCHKVTKSFVSDTQKTDETSVGMNFLPFRCDFRPLNCNFVCTKPLK